LFTWTPVTKKVKDMMDNVIDEPITDTTHDVDVDTASDGDSALKKILFEHDILSHEATAVLIARAQNGDDDARNQIIEANYRFARLIALRRRKILSSNLDIDDLTQVGALGLINAIQRFDVNRNIRFTTCAEWSIRDSVDQYIMSFRSIVRIPTYLQKVMGSVSYPKRTDKKLYHEKYKEDAKLLLETFFVDSIHSPNTKTGAPQYHKDSEIAIASTLLSPEGFAVARSEMLATRQRISILIRTIDNCSINTNNIDTFLYHTGLKDGMQHTLGETADWFGITRSGAEYRVKVVFEHLQAVGLPYTRLKDIQDEFHRIEDLEELVQSI
jgi:RNA polymerase sigma factor (sigma-70 family)